MSLGEILTAILFGLKVCEYLTISWWLVAMPLIVELIVWGWVDIRRWMR